jgi:hypothetical protein
MALDSVLRKGLLQELVIGHELEIGTTGDRPADRTNGQLVVGFVSSHDGVLTLPN